MKLSEILYREIAKDFLNGTNRFTQMELSTRLGISIGNINKVLMRLKEINAVKIEHRSFHITELDRLLLYWATHRRLDRDIIYRASSDMRVVDIENNLPNGIAFTAYTAYKKIYRSIPADYSEVFVYATDEALDTIKERFPKRGRFPNIIVLNTDKILKKRIMSYGVNVTSIPNIFVDLWNIKTWYSLEFARALSKKLFG